MRRIAAVSTVLVLAVVAASCGGDDDSSPTATDAVGTAAPDATTTTDAAPDTTGTDAPDTTTADTTAPDTTTPGTAEPESRAVEGCESGWVEDYTLDPDIPSARCEPGFPAPVPLKEKITLRVQMTGSNEPALPLLIGIDKGEFAKENLEIEPVYMGSGDAMQLLAQGEVDIVTNLTGGTYNLINDDFPLTVVAAGFYQNPESQDGLWAKKDLEIADLKGKIVAASVFATTAFYGAYRGFQEAGFSFSDLQHLPVDTADGALALKNGAADAALVLGAAAVATGLDQDPNFHFLAPFYWPGEPDSGILIGPSSDTPEMEEAIVAFLRAYVRTISTYLAGDYKNDPAVQDDVARLLEIPLETLQSSPPYIFDYYYRDGTLTSMQEMFRDAEALTYECCIPESEYLDRTFLERALTRPDS